MAEKNIEEILEEIGNSDFDTISTVSTMEASKLNRFTKICSKIIIRTGFWEENKIKKFSETVSKYMKNLGYEDTEIKTAGSGAKSYINVITSLKASTNVKKVVDAILEKMVAGKSVRTNIVRTVIDFEPEEETENESVSVAELSGVILISDYNDSDKSKIVGRYRLNKLESGFFCNMYRGSCLRESSLRYHSADEQISFRDNGISVVFTYKSGVGFDCHYTNAVRIGSAFQIDKGDYSGSPSDLIKILIGNKMEKEIGELADDLQRASDAANETLKVSSEYNPELLVKSKVRVEESAPVDDEQ